jgi:hypothetical protein
MLSNEKKPLLRMKKPPLRLHAHLADNSLGEGIGEPL